MFTPLTLNSYTKARCRLGSSMSKAFMKILVSNRGASAVEYALIIALVAAVIGVGIAAFGEDLNTFFEGLFDTLGL